MTRWSVTADDRTGALEMAAFVARPGAPASLSVFPDLSGDVVDLGSRALAPDEAAARAGSVGRGGSGRAAHKIDSTLRGNWAAEVRARSAACGRAAVVVPAWPALGRTCEGGVVSAAGRPVGAVADHLPEADLVADAAALERWLAAHAGAVGCVASVDAVDESALAAVAGVLAEAPVLVAGPAGAIGAVLRAGSGSVDTASLPAAGRPSAAGEVLVVCASATDVARRQLGELALRRPEAAVVAAPALESGGSLQPEHAAVVASAARRCAGDFAAVIVVGGDTAAAFLGGGRRLVGGFAAPGMPWSLDAEGGGPLVVSKAGGFGDDRALVALVDLLVG